LDPDTAIGGPQHRFPSTRLSLLEAASAGAGLPNDALERVTALYWKPVYHFIRVKFRKSNEDAKDLTQGFFATALERDFFARFDASQASFRTYLRMAVERYAASQYAAAGRQKRGGDVRFAPLEEASAAGESPEEVFEREWQRQLFALALDELRAYCELSGRGIQFALFAAYDLADGARPSYAELAARYAVAETSVTNHLAWARRTLRQLVNDRLRGVTAGEGEMRDEMRRLWK